MPLIPQHMLGAVAFIYGSEADAKKDRRFQASALVASVESSIPNYGSYYYAITAAHVVSQLKTLYLRFNKRNGGQSIIVKKESEWEMDTVHDVAVTGIVFGEEVYTYVPLSMFLTKKLAVEKKIGPGDEIFLVSRYVREDIRYKTNYPLMRFGNIAMSPTPKEKYFTVELRSIGGHSGSPVFVYDLPYSLGRMRDSVTETFTLFFLGVDLGHIVHYEPLVSIDPVRQRKIEHRKWMAGSNIALSQVAPAWAVARLLNRPTLQKARAAFDKNLLTHGFGDFILDKK